jgi:hypothetical protein
MGNRKRRGPRAQSRASILDPKRVLICVSCGLADYAADPGVTVLKVDTDDATDAPEDVEPLPASWADLAERFGLSDYVDTSLVAPGPQTVSAWAAGAAHLLSALLGEAAAIELDERVAADRWRGSDEERVATHSARAEHFKTVCVLLSLAVNVLSKASEDGDAPAAGVTRGG